MGNKQKPGVDCDHQVNLAGKIMITAEYLPGSMNLEADRESRQTRDSS